MGYKILTVTALASILVLPIPTPFAQQSSNPSAAGQSMSSQHGAFSNATHASDIIGKSAYGSSGEDIGKIDDLLINSKGQVEMAVVDVGGFLGVGQHSVAIKWDQIKISPSDNRVVVAMSKEQLKAAPEYRKSAQMNIPSENQQAKTPGNRQNPE